MNEKMQLLWNACIAWRDEHKPLCSESIYQRDSIQEALPELAQSVCAIIGYAKNSEDN